jgi:hypothetical protein
MRCRSSNVAIAASMVIWAALTGCAGHIDDTASVDSGSAACVPSGATGDSGSIPPTFATVRLVLGGGGAVMPCAAAPCHATGGMAPPGRPLTLQDTPALYATLTSYVSSGCGDIKLVNPGKPDESALLKILRGPCGATPRMPYMCSGDACIPDEYIAAISQWVANCAPAQ